MRMRFSVPLIAAAAVLIATSSFAQQPVNPSQVGGVGRPSTGGEPMHPVKKRVYHPNQPVNPSQVGGVGRPSTGGEPMHAYKKVRHRKQRLNPSQVGGVGRPKAGGRVQ